MRVWIITVAVLVTLLGLAGWRLKVAWQDLALAEQQVDQVTQERDAQRVQTERLAKRFDQLDTVLLALSVGTAENSKQLDTTLAAIRGIKKTQGDSDATMRCLDLPLPRQLVDQLREPAAVRR